MDRQNFNDEVAEQRSQNKGHWQRDQRIKVILGYIGKGKKVADLACFDGRISERIKNHGNEVTGVEISELGVKGCLARGINCVKHDVEKPFPFENNSFDCVFAGEIIEHIYDTDKFLQEIARILKPKGVLVLSTPNIAALTRRIRLMLGINPNIDIGLLKSAGHIRYYTRASLSNLVKRNSFSVEAITGDFISLNRFKSVLGGKMLPGLANGIIMKVKVKK